MEIIYTREELIKFRELNKAQNKNIGFVPTMGALHLGHMSLIDKAKSNSDVVVASIFVNPRQFNSIQDFNNYPMSIDQDLEMLMRGGCDAVFVPSVEVMYGDSDYLPYKIDIGYLDTILEGAKRPGHFAGVIEVVHALFHLVKPDQVYFGMKDYQQVMVIEKLIHSMGSDIQLFKCNTYRDEDGLATSSRNRRLNPTQRTIALKLYETLTLIQNAYQKEDISILKKSYIDKLNALDNVEVDYIDIVDSQTLNSLRQWNPAGENLAILAVYVGNVRLIDNLLF